MQESQPPLPTIPTHDIAVQGPIVNVPKSLDYLNLKNQLSLNYSKLKAELSYEKGVQKFISYTLMAKGKKLRERLNAC